MSKARSSYFFSYPMPWSKLNKFRIMSYFEFLSSGHLCLIHHLKLFRPHVASTPSSRVSLKYQMWVPVGSRRFRSIYLAKLLITIACYSFLSLIPWLLYREGSRGFPWTLLRGFSWVPIDFDRYIWQNY